MAASRFRNNLRFALRRESSEIREKIPLNRVEKIGDTLCWLIYDFKDSSCKVLFDPRFLTLFFTLFAMTFTTFLFYPSATWSVFDRILVWIINHINGSYLRFCLWILCEVTIFGIGVRAFGRFANQQLLKHYQA